MGVFDRIACFDERALDPDFSDHFRDRLHRSVRGFGYWCWKPQILLQVIRDLNDGDILVYADAGCHMNAGGTARLLGYIAALSDKRPIVAFRLLGVSAVHGPLLNAFWTKEDLFAHLCVGAADPLRRVGQVQAGTLVLMKTAQTVALLEDWRRVYLTDWSLVDDSPSILPNAPGFVEHRHDQAVLSILVARAQALILSAAETYCDGCDWSRLASYPFHAKRDRRKSFRFRALAYFMKVTAKPRRVLRQTMSQ